MDFINFSNTFFLAVLAKNTIKSYFFPIDSWFASGVKYNKLVKDLLRLVWNDQVKLNKQA